MIGKKILIVEDQVISSMTIEENLILLGYSVSDIVDRGENVIDSIKKNKPDLILMDINLKGEMTGVVAAELVFNQFDIPVIFLTASGTDETFTRAKKTHPFGYITKPFVPKDLKVAIEIGLYNHEQDLKLLKTQKLLKESQRLSKIGSWEYDLVENKSFLTDEVYNILDLEKGTIELSYEHMKGYFHQDDIAEIEKAYCNSVKNNSIFEIQQRLYLKDETIKKYVEITGSTIFNEKGDPIKSYGSIQDITQEVLSKQKIIESEKNFRDLFINSIDEVYLIDFKTFNIIDINFAALEALGYEKDEIADKKVTCFLPENRVEIFEHVITSIEKNSRTNGSQEILCEHKKKDGSIYSVSIKAKKISYAGKDLLLVQAKNITEKLVLEKRKEQDNEVREGLRKILSLTLDDISLENFLEEAMKLIISLPFLKELSKVGIYVANDKNELELVVSNNFEEEIEKKRSTLVEGENGSDCDISFMSDTHFFNDCDILRPICDKEYAMYAVPITANNNIIGLLNIYVEGDQKRSKFKIEILKTIANTLGIILMRKKNQEALKLSESRFRELTETIKEAFWLTDCSTDVLLYISPSYEEIFEKSCESLYNDSKSWSEYIHPEDKERVIEGYLRSKDDDYNVEYRLMFPDGRVKWLHERQFPIIEGSKVVRMAGYSVDITERKLVEEELILSEYKFKNYVENSADVISIHDKNFVLKYVSPNTKFIFGYEPTEHLGVSSFEFIHPSDVKHLTDTLLNFNRINGTTKFFKSRYKHKKGHWVWISSSVKYVSDENQVPYFIVNSRDISAQKKAENELIESEEKFRELFDKSSDATLLIENGAFIDCNQAAVKMLNYISKDEILNTHPSQISPENQPDGKSSLLKSNEILENVLLTGESCRFEWTHKKKNGELIPLEIILTLFIDTEEKKVIHVVWRDITERKRVEEELILSEYKFKNYVENSADVISIHDENFVLKYVSPNTKLIFGYEATEHLGASPFEYLHPSDIDHVANTISNFKRINGNTKYFKSRYKHKKGHWVWVSSSIKYVSSENQVPYFIVNSRDISDQKKAELELIESEEKFRSFFENNLSGIYRVGKNKKILECNNAFAKIIGYNSREEVIGMNTGDIYRTEDDFVKLLKDKQGKLESHESYVTLLKNDEQVRFLENAICIKNETNETLYYEGSIIDTTSIFEIEKEKKLLELFPAENPNPVFRMDYEFNIMYSNPPGEKLLDEISIDNYLVDKKLTRKIARQLEKKVKYGKTEFKSSNSCYVFYIFNAQEFKYINIYAIDITELKNTQADYLQLNLDLEQLVEERTEKLNSTVLELNTEIKDRKRAEKKATKSLNEKEILLNEITHRVKNNLQVISSLLSLQKETVNSNEAFDILTETGHRIKSMALIHETLYRSSDFSWINIRNYINSLVSYISNSFDVNNIIISCDIDELNLSIDTATSCGMIIMELITNSFKYAFNESEKGEIKLKMTSVDDQYFKLIISDNGKGYPENIDFKSTKTLGMQLVFGLASQLQGSINKVPVKGTSFEITFKDTKKHKYE